MSDATSEPTAQEEFEPVCSFEHCEKQSLSKCKRCGLLYCLDHASEIDPMMFCVNCAVPSDIEMQQKPLVDKDGVQHQGRVLVPTGPLYVITSKLINEMNDDELKRFIEYNQRAIKEAENHVDYLKIRQGQAEGVAFDRKVAYLARQEDGTIKFKIPKEQPKVVTARRKTDVKAKPDPVASIMNSLKGVSPEVLVKMMEDLKKKKVG